MDDKLAVTNFPTPNNVDNILLFLRLASYYSQFMNNFAAVAETLTKLLKKDSSFHCNALGEKSFQVLKYVLKNTYCSRLSELCGSVHIVCGRLNTRVRWISHAMR